MELIFMIFQRQNELRTVKQDENGETTHMVKYLG